MRILAVDQSFTSSGIIILENGYLIHAERYKSNTENNVYQRAWEITQHVTHVAKEFTVDFTALEGLAYAKFGDATRDLAGLQFVLVTTLRYIELLNVVVIPPNIVKKVATGKGNSKKEDLFEALPLEVKNKFKQELNLKKTTGLFDLTDAYWIGQAALLTNNNRRE